MIVLDTNVISELARPQPDVRVVIWIDNQEQTGIYLTSVSLAETLYGIERLPLGQRKRDLSTDFGILLEERFRSRVLSFDEESARGYALITTRRERIGQRMGTADAEIASICLANGAALATRNTRDFEETGIELINPWEA